MAYRVPAWCHFRGYFTPSRRPVGVLSVHSDPAHAGAGFWIPFGAAENGEAAVLGRESRRYRGAGRHKPAAKGHRQTALDAQTKQDAGNCE